MNLTHKKKGYIIEENNSKKINIKRVEAYCISFPLRKNL